MVESPFQNRVGAVPVNLRTPSPAQQKGLAYALPKARIALFMQMRLGKTLVAIRWARHHRLDRVLVVAPNDTLDQLRAELILEGVAPTDILILAGSKIQKYWQASEVDTGWVLVNYEAITTVKRRKGTSTVRDITGRDILRLPWNGIILDESTKIRSPKAATTKTFLGFTGHIPYRCIMSGLPNPMGELDFFTQMAFLHGDFLGYSNFWIYREKLYFPDAMGWDWKPKKGTSEVVRQETHRRAFFLSRKDAGVDKATVRERRVVEMTPAQRRMYVSIEKDFSFKDEETIWAPVRQTWLARVAGGFSPDKDDPKCLSMAKAHVIKDLLENDLKQEQLVIWFRFNQELDMMAQFLRKMKIGLHTVKGGTSAKVDRDAPTNYQKGVDFQSGKVQVILMQQRMGRYGWDLSASDTAIYYSNTYDWEMRAQSQDRILNVRKNSKLLLIDLMTKGTIDEDAVETLNDRRVDALMFNSRFRERVLQSLASRYPNKPQHDPRVRRILPGDAR